MSEQREISRFRIYVLCTDVCLNMDGMVNGEGKYKNLLLNENILGWIEAKKPQQVQSSIYKCVCAQKYTYKYKC